MTADMQQTFRSIIETAGGTVISGTRRHPQKSSAGESNALQHQPAGRISKGGEIIHELGTVRMGTDPKTSALNKNCQAHDMKNVFVADAAPFVSNPDKKITLTIAGAVMEDFELSARPGEEGRALEMGTDFLSRRTVLV